MINFLVKRLIITVLIIASFPSAVKANIFGKYSSYYEAYQACMKWKRKNNEKNFPRCKKDNETKQVLGLHGFKVKKRYKY